MKSLLLLIMTAFFFTQTAYAGCTVDEMTKMARGGSGKDVIRGQCDYEVDDAPRCNFSRVLELAMAKKVKSDIDAECGPCDHPTCELLDGSSCKLGSKAPRGIKEGDDCHCFPYNGEVSCNN